MPEVQGTHSSPALATHKVSVTLAAAVYTDINKLTIKQLEPKIAKRYRFFIDSIIRRPKDTTGHNHWKLDAGVL